MVCQTHGFLQPLVIPASGPFAIHFYYEMPAIKSTTNFSYVKAYLFVEHEEQALSYMPVALTLFYNLLYFG